MTVTVKSLLFFPINIDVHKTIRRLRKLAFSKLEKLFHSNIRESCDAEKNMDITVVIMMMMIIIMITA